MGRGHINLGPSTSGPEETGPSSAVTGLGCRSTNEDRLSFSESEEGEEDLDSHRRREIGKDGMLSPLWRVKSTWEKGEPSSSSLVDETGVLRKSGAVQLRPGATVTTTRTDENQVEREKEINTIRLMNPSNLKPTGLFPRSNSALQNRHALRDRQGQADSVEILAMESLSGARASTGSSDLIDRGTIRLSAKEGDSPLNWKSL